MTTSKNLTSILSLPDDLLYIILADVAQPHNTSLVCKKFRTATEGAFSFLKKSYESDSRIASGMKNIRGTDTEIVKKIASRILTVAKMTFLQRTLQMLSWASEQTLFSQGKAPLKYKPFYPLELNGPILR